MERTLGICSSSLHLSKDLELAKQGKIKHVVHEFHLSEINDAITKLKEGQVKGRAVIVPQ